VAVLEQNVGELKWAKNAEGELHVVAAWAAPEIVEE
jgi:hypothetical protein